MKQAEAHVPRHTWFYFGTWWPPGNPDEAVYLKASSLHHSGAGETIACSLDPRGFRKGECARKHKQESLTSRSGGEESAAAGSRAACSLAGSSLWPGRARRRWGSKARGKRGDPEPGQRDTPAASEQGAPCSVRVPERKLRMKLLWQAKMVTRAPRPPRTLLCWGNLPISRFLGPGCRSLTDRSHRDPRALRGAFLLCFVSFPLFVPLLPRNDACVFRHRLRGDWDLQMRVRRAKLGKDGTQSGGAAPHSALQQQPFNTDPRFSWQHGHPGGWSLCKFQWKPREDV